MIERLKVIANQVRWSPIGIACLSDQDRTIVLRALPELVDILEGAVNELGAPCGNKNCGHLVCIGVRALREGK